MTTEEVIVNGAPPLRVLATDVAIASALLTIGITVASFVGRHYTLIPAFYQSEFGPAVMAALGKGFEEPVVEAGSPLDDFLHRRRMVLASGDVMVASSKAPNQFQHATRYLMLAVAWQWKRGGISWDAVWGIAATFYGLSVVASYAVLRLFVPAGFAAGGALYLCLSTVWLEQMPHLRDYSKAPFILAALFFTALVALRPLSRRSLTLACLACGAVVGVGIGFRSDVGVMAPIFLASLVLFRDRRPWRGLRAKGLGAAAFLLALTIASAPVVFRIYGGGSNPYHLVLLGFTPRSEANLLIAPSMYGYGLEYSDLYVGEAVSHYSQRRTGLPATYPSDAYNDASRAYWLRILRHFPADAFTRVLAAGDVIMNLPFQNRAPDFLDASFPGQRAIDQMFGVFGHLNGHGGLMALLLLIAGSAAGVKQGGFAAAQLAGVFGYSSLEFEQRHVFYLEIVSVLAMTMVAAMSWRWIVRTIRHARRDVPPGAPVRAVLLPVATVALLLTSVVTLRAYQSVHLKDLFQQYINAPRNAVAAEYSDEGDVVVARWPAMVGHPAAGTRRTGAYYVIDFDWQSEAAPVAIGLRYRSTLPPDLSSVVSMVATSGINRVFFPVYGDPPLLEFDGVEIATSLRRSVRGIYDVAPGSALPLPLDLRLSSEWATEHVYERMRREGDPNAQDLHFLDSLPRRTRIAWVGRLSAPTTIPTAGAVEAAYDPATAISPRGIIVDTRPPTPAAYALTFKPVVLEKGGALLAYGRLESGGLAAGLLKGNRWYRYAAVNERGNFVAIVSVDEAGTYVPIIAHDVPKAQWRNRFTIFRFGADPHPLVQP